MEKESLNYYSSKLLLGSCQYEQYMITQTVILFSSNCDQDRTNLLFLPSNKQSNANIYRCISFIASSNAATSIHRSRIERTVVSHRSNPRN